MAVPVGSRASSRFFSLCVVAALLGVAAPASGGARGVALGEVTARGPARAARLFRKVVAEELHALDVGSRATGAYVLSASLLALDAEAGDESAVVSCVVSATLRNETGGALVALLRGSARASDAPAEIEATKLEAMRAAVRSAIGRVPEALEKASD